MKKIILVLMSTLVYGCATSGRVDKLENTVRAIAYVQNVHAQNDSYEQVQMIKQIQATNNRLDAVQEQLEELEIKVSQYNEIFNKNFNKKLLK